MFLKLSLVIFFLLFIILFIPSSIEISTYLKSNSCFLDIKKKKEKDSKIIFKLCGILPLYNKKLFEPKKVDKQEQENKIKKVFNNKNTILELLKKSYINKFVLDLGFNLNDPISNSYVNATLNTIICLYINSNYKKFNFNRLYYQTYIAENLLDLNFECIIKISLADTIKVVGKEYFKLLKEEKTTNKILSFKKRSEEYGRASD